MTIGSWTDHERTYLRTIPTPVQYDNDLSFLATTQVLEANPMPHMDQNPWAKSAINLETVNSEATLLASSTKDLHHIQSKHHCYHGKSNAGIHITSNDIGNKFLTNPTLHSRCVFPTYNICRFSQRESYMLM